MIRIMIVEDEGIFRDMLKYPWAQYPIWRS